MFEKFDLNWFTTVPGILSGLGCLLIIIAVIIFITSLFGKKGNKDNAQDIPNEIPEISKENSVVNETPNVAPVEVTPVASTPEATPVEITPVASTPEVTNVTPQSTYNGINIEPNIQPVENNPESLPYGGAQISSNINIEPEKNKVIYGGADPTEGTGMIPKINEKKKNGDEIESL